MARTLSAASKRAASVQPNGDALVEPAHTRRHRAEEEEVQQELAYNKGANYDEDDMDEDYVAEEEGESEEVEMEPMDEEQELPEPSMNDLVAILANQTRLLEALVRNQQEPCENVHDQQIRLSEFIRFKPPTFDSAEDPLEADD